MSEELLQRNLINHPEKIGKFEFRNIGSTSLLQLKKAGIIADKDYNKFEKRKPDAIISIPNVINASIKSTLGIIENKSSKEFKTKEQKQKAIKQGLEVAQVLDAKFLIATDTIDTIWINAKNGEEILDEKGRVIKTAFDTKNEEVVKLIDKIIISIDAKNSQLREPRLMDPTDLAKRIWQILWSISGATPESCLYSFVELFIFKYLSDLGVLQHEESFDYLLKLYKNKTPEKVIDYYAKNIRLHIKNDLFPRGGDGTTIINGTVFVNNEDEAIEGRSTAFKKILEEFEKYGKLENIHPDFKSKLFETFLKESLSEKKWGQFFTPLKVVKAIVQMAESDINKDSIICDPAGGVGKFVLEAIKPRLNEFYKVEKNKLKHSIKLFGFDIGFDKDEQKTIILAKANMLIYFSELIRNNKEITTEFSKLFNETFELKKNSILGTLANKENEAYTLILSNPPYVTSGSSNIKAEIVRKNLQDHYKVNAMGLEGLFMEWIIRALKPNGKAFIVVPDGIFNRQNDKNLRQFILDECIIDGIISLPIKTFFSTPKKTYILAITKKTDKAVKQKEPVFTYLVSEIGESRDVYRFDIEQNHLKDAVDWFNQFKNANRKTFKFNDKRLKIQPIEKFDPETNWSVERWWSKEEQIELGIVEEVSKTKFDDLPEIIEDVANNILNFKEEILLLKEKKKSEINFKYFKLNSIFNFPSIKGITKTYVENNIGDIPVYGGRINEEPIGYVKDNLKNVKYFENTLAWNREGSVGYVFWHKHKFTTNDHHRPIKIKVEFEDSLDKEYLRLELQNTIMAEGFVWSKTASKQKVEKLFIKIPITSKGEFDLVSQKEIIEKYEYVSSLKSKIEEYKKQVEELSVSVTNDYKCKLVKIPSILEILGEENLTKAYIENNKGEYPVYSGQLEDDGIFGYINSYKYEDTFLTWVTYGNSGHIKKVSGKFSIGRNNCGLKPLQSNIDIDYIMFIAQPIFIENVKGEKQKSLPQSIVKQIEIPIPITPKGDFDLTAQKEIAEKYRKIEQIKKSITAELDKLANIEIDYV